MGKYNPEGNVDASYDAAITNAGILYKMIYYVANKNRIRLGSRVARIKKKS